MITIPAWIVRLIALHTALPRFLYRHFMGHEFVTARPVEDMGEQLYQRDETICKAAVVLVCQKVNESEDGEIDFHGFVRECYAVAVMANTPGHEHCEQARGRIADALANLCRT